MPKQIAGTQFVKVTHAKTKAEGQVPLAAVKHYEKNGWKAEPKELKAAEKAEETPKAEEPKADETATADSKKKSNS
jgi:hypothetical protein